MRERGNGTAGARITRAYYWKPEVGTEIRGEINRRAYGENKKKQGENSACATWFDYVY